jgi:hypothetical protein
MSKPDTQNFRNHAKFDPPYHFFLASVFFASVIVAIVHAVRFSSFISWWFVLVSVAAVVALFRLRQYPLKVQDRVIRLEERLRLQALAPEEWHAQIYRLTEDQLVGLRFAGNDEVVELARQALEHNLNRKRVRSSSSEKLRAAHSLSH